MSLSHAAVGHEEATAGRTGLLVLRGLMYAGAAVAALLVAWLLMPYPENGCPGEAGTTCTIPSDRQRRWLAVVPGAVVLGALAAEAVAARRTWASRWVAFLLPALLGGALVLAGYQLLA